MTSNEEIIAHQIQGKKRMCPYTAPPAQILKVRTDVNEFPYPRFFRGQAFDQEPRVWEREAGYSPLVSFPSPPVHPPSLQMAPRDAYFQAPCSTQFPSFLPPPSKSDSRYESSPYGCVYSSP